MNVVGAAQCSVTDATREELDRRLAHAIALVLEAVVRRQIEAQSRQRPAA